MFTTVLAQATVSDLDRARAWYDVLFDRTPDAAAERLMAAGLASEGAGPITSGRALQLTDPDGNRVTIVGT